MSNEAPADQSAPSTGPSPTGSSTRPAALAALVVALVLGLLVLLFAFSDTERSSSVNFEIVGKVAPPITAQTLSGDSYDLESQRGNWVVVNFFASWCVGCQIEHPELVTFADRHVDDGAGIVAVMFGDTEQAATDFFAELGGSWPAIVDRSEVGTLALDYGVTGVPETLLVSPAGRVVAKWTGARGVTADVLDRAIADYEAGE